MSATGEYFLRMREIDFNALTEQQRNIFTYVEKVEINEYENHKATKEEKMQRVELFNKLALISKIDEVFMASSMKEAEHNYLEYYDKLQFKREK